jgi:hypothetical protein
MVATPRQSLVILINYQVLRLASTSPTEVIVPKKVEITCDFCNKDLTTCASGWSETRLHLEAQGIYNTSNISYGMPQRKEISDAYFCDLSCLESWLTKRAADLAALLYQSSGSGLTPNR